MANCWGHSGAYIHRLRNQQPISGHFGCVNSLNWDSRGQWLLSASDDQKLRLWRTADLIQAPKVERVAVRHSKPLIPSIEIPTSHESNILLACFHPLHDVDQPAICASASMESLVELTRLDFHRQPEPDQHLYCPLISGDDSVKNAFPVYREHQRGLYEPRPFYCHQHQLSLVQGLTGDYLSPWLWLSAAKTVNSYDTRVANHCDCANQAGCQRFSLWESSTATSILSMDVHPDQPYWILLGLSDDSVQLHDRRFMKRPFISFHGTQSLLDTVSAESQADYQRTLADQNNVDPSENIASHASLIYSFLPSYLRKRRLRLPASAFYSPQREPMIYDTLRQGLTCVSFDPQDSNRFLVSYMGGDLVVCRANAMRDEPWDGQRRLDWSDAIKSTPDTSTDAKKETEAPSDVVTDVKNRKRRASRPLSAAIPDFLDVPTMLLPFFEPHLESYYDRDIESVCYGHRNIETVLKEARFLPSYSFQSRSPLLKQPSKHIASGSDDGYVYVWSLQPKKCKAILEFITIILKRCFSPRTK